MANTGVPSGDVDVPPLDAWLQEHSNNQFLAYPGPFQAASTRDPAHARPEWLVWRLRVDMLGLVRVENGMDEHNRCEFAVCAGAAAAAAGSQPPTEVVAASPFE